MNKIWSKYKNLILGLVFAVLFTLLILFSYKKLKFLFFTKDSTDDLQVSNDVKSNVLKLHPLTYSKAQYTELAEQLYTVLKDYIWITKAPWEKINVVFSRLKHYGDYLELKSAFGLRSYGLGIASNQLSLPSYINASADFQSITYFNAYVTGWELKYKKILGYGK